MNKYWYLLLTPLFLCAATSTPLNIHITVTPSGGPTVVASPASITSGGTETVQVSGSDGASHDWVGLYAVGTPNSGTPIIWNYLNGTKTPPSVGVGSATLTFPLPGNLAPGQYTFNLEFDNGTTGYVLGASSNTVTVTSGSIACDIGPPYSGAIPAGAQAAGLTHCAVNLDFTQFTNVNQIIECFGAVSPILYHDDPTTTGVACDATHYAMVVDGGVHALKASWLTSDGTSIPNLTGSTTAGTAFPAYLGFTVPNAQFLEMTWRLNSTTQCNTNCLLFGPFEYPHSSDDRAFVEMDPDETYTGPGGGNHFLQTNLISSIFFPTYDPTNYHTYGVRVTSDGSDNYAYCNYFSSAVVQGLSAATFNSCRSESSAGTATSRKMLILPWGPNPNDVSFFTAGVDMYFQRATLWECPAWRGASENNNIFTGNQCNGTLLTGSP